MIRTTQARTVALSLLVATSVGCRGLLEIHELDDNVTDAGSEEVGAADGSREGMSPFEDGGQEAAAADGTAPDSGSVDTFDAGTIAESSSADASDSAATGDADSGCSGGMHYCGGTCVNDTSTSSCGPTSCAVCPGPSGGSGMASCDGTSCGIACAASTPTYCTTTNACVDTASDNANCGSCAHACTGATPLCSNSMCVPLPTWCTTQSAPAGVAAGDFQCIDFDKGLPPAAIWAPTQSNSATFALSTAAFSSSPNSLKMTAPPAADATQEGAATLAWTNVAAATIKAITVSAQVNPIGNMGVLPPWTGSVEVLCAKYNGANSKACLEYNSTPKLTIKWEYIPNAAALGTCDLTALWMTGAWNSVKLSIASTGVVTVTLNGAVTPCIPTFGPGNDTSATVTIGPHAMAETTSPLSLYFDNVLAYVNR